METDPYRTLAWVGGTDGYLRLLDQTQLPAHLCYRDCRDVEAVWTAIQTLCVRGAPAIGVAAAYGAVIGVRARPSATRTDVREVTGYLRTSRPTAVNLFWALDRIDRAAEVHLERKAAASLVDHLLAEARAIEADDVRTCRLIGQQGAALVPEGGGVLTHCNAGALATAGIGTALAALFVAWEQGKRFHVYVDETRPLLQGARLTAWELSQRGIPATLLCDNMAAQVMREGKIQLILVGADRIAANGDTANKIGTYGVAVLAHVHHIPFYVAAPCSTFDLNLNDGVAIPIECRAAREVSHWHDRPTAPEGIDVYNPAFDLTPAQYIRGIVTEHGIVCPPNTHTIRAMFASQGNS